MVSRIKWLGHDKGFLCNAASSERRFNDIMFLILRKYVVTSINNATPADKKACNVMNVPWLDCPLQTINSNKSSVCLWETDKQ